MASVSAETLILFIASMIIAASVAGTFTNSVGRLSEALSEQGVQVSEEVRSDIEVISDAGSDAVYDDGTNNITLLVKNTGSERLDAERGQIDVLVDGQYTADFEVRLLGDATDWNTGDVVEVEIDATSVSDGGLGNGDHRVQVVVNGDEEVFEFRV